MFKKIFYSIVVIAFVSCNKNENKQKSVQLAEQAMKLFIQNRDSVQIVKVLNLFDSSIAVYPQNSNAYINKATVLLSINKPSDALFVIKNAKKYINNPYIFNLEGFVYHKEFNDTILAYKSYNMAAKLYDSMLNLENDVDKKDVMILNKAYLLLYSNKKQEATEEFDKMSKNNKIKYSEDFNYFDTQKFIENLW